MAAETVKLNSGFDMPMIGLGTWQVCNFLFCSFRGLFMFCCTAFSDVCWCWSALADRYIV